MKRQKIAVPRTPGADSARTLRAAGTLAQDAIHRIASDARHGYQWDAIAARCGMAPKTLHRMLSQGKRRREQIDEWAEKLREFASDATDAEIIDEIGPPPQENDLCELYDACAREHANAQCELVDIVRLDATQAQNVGSAKWMLVTRFEGWGRGGGSKREALDDSNIADNNAIDLLSAKIAAFEAASRALAPAPNDGAGQV